MNLRGVSNKNILRVSGQSCYGLLNSDLMILL